MKIISILTTSVLLMANHAISEINNTENGNEKIPPAWQIAKPKDRPAEPILFDSPITATHSTEEMGLKEVEPYLNSKQEGVYASMKYVASMTPEELKRFASDASITENSAIAFHDKSVKTLSNAEKESIKHYKAFCKKLLNHTFNSPVQRYEIEDFIIARDKSESIMFEVIAKGIDSYKAAYPQDYNSMFKDISANFSYIEHNDEAVSPSHWVKYYKNDCKLIK
ncbi:hypothetical protein H0A36_25210 [Endozoicomonas sp. SM1973]|uniref:Uncharacterized protein n=1 Tax=Spartinivicinus marinus TaxID=2994442 RepID=A0A853I7N1_9GAMM|nr:hypothetical protein [Spartinivicinus marinus]MCX4027787.1 hypothetical protein [Spartinivicinus marinus]NYZ69323.1 hypothetical protein [Spartinivicinus marinus]